MKVGAIIHVHGGYLLQLRDNKPDIEWPGYWGLFGGHVDEGETYANAMFRELEEELCWWPNAITCVKIVDEVAYFRCHFTSIAHMNQQEGAGMGIFHPRHLPEPMIPFVRHLLLEAA